MASLRLRTNSLLLVLICTALILLLVALDSHRRAQLSKYYPAVASVENLTSSNSNGGCQWTGCQCTTANSERSPARFTSVAVPANARRDRVLCWVLTSPKTISTRGASVNSTWLRRCDKQLFMSSMPFPGDSRVINIISEDNYKRLPNKTFSAFKYVYDNYLNESDWFMKADDDTYVFVENLKYTLSAFDPDEPVYLGHHFRPHIPQGYNSGGAGYVLSREALRRFGAMGYGQIGAVCPILTNFEDVEMGRCMDRLGVKLASTLDATGRSRFHGFQASSHIGGKPVQLYAAYDADGGRTGPETVSDFAVTFHYVKPEEMHLLEYFAYHFKLFGKSITVGPSSTER